MSDDTRGQDVLDQETLDPKIAAIVEGETRAKRGFLFCAACSHVIGHVQDRIEVQGSFQHTCTNPYGFVHHFGCHREAPGCAVVGSAHSADSWFAGFRWRLAQCGSCDAHLGWQFEKPDERFFGLILDRIQAD